MFVRTLILQGGWQQTVIAIATIVAAGGVLAASAGAFLAWRSIREDAKGRHAEIAVEMGKRWDSADMSKVRKFLKGHDGATLLAHYQHQEALNSEEFFELLRVANFFEDMGVLFKLDILSAEWVDLTMGSAVMDYWSMWYMVAETGRARVPTLYSNWQLLAETIWTLRNGGSRS